MKIKFWWEETFGRLKPACESDTRNRDGVSLLCCLLMDSGGGHYLDALPWLEDGIRRVEAVKRGEAESHDWARDAWGALLSHDRAKIYSLYDEKYAEDMGLDAFGMALLAWVDFIQSPPEAKTTRTIVV